MKRAFIGVALAALLLTGCNNFALVSHGSTISQKGLSLTASGDWSRKSEGNVDMWTRHGVFLDQLRIVHGVTDGERILMPSVEEYPAFGAKNLDRSNAPQFRADMLLPEIKDFVAAILSSSGAVNVQISNITAEPFAEKPGFAMDFAFTAPGGLQFLGFAKGAMVDEKLHMVTYHAPKQHYFPTDRDLAEKIARSAKLHGSGT